MLTRNFFSTNINVTNTVDLGTWIYVKNKQKSVKKLNLLYAANK